MCFFFENFTWSNAHDSSYLQRMIFEIALLGLNYVVFPVILFHISCYLWERKWESTKDKTSTLPLPKGKMGIPLLGEMLQFLFIGETYQRKCQKEYGNVYKTHVFGRPTVNITGQENVRKILLGEGTLVEAVWPGTTRRVLGTHGIVNGDKETHTKIKRLALKAFSSKYIGKYTPVMTNRIESHIQQWQEEGVVSVFEACTQMVSKTMLTVLLGIQPDDPNIERYISAEEDIVNSILTLPINLPGFNFYKGLKARKFIFEKVETDLRSKFQPSDETANNTEDLFESVIVNILKLAREEENTEITLQNLQNLALEFIFAGSQSLRCSSSLLVLHLCQRPKIVERLRSEINDAGLWNAPLQNLELGDLNSLTFLCRVVNETLRVTPTIPAAVRVAVKTFEIGGYQVPKGWQVVYNIRYPHEKAAGKILHTGQKTEFDPDKDLYDPTSLNANLHPDQNGTSKSSCSFIPFGKGARMCAGKNCGLLFLKIFLFQLVRSVDISLVSDPIIATAPMMRACKSVRVAVKSYSLASKE